MKRGDQSRRTIRDFNLLTLNMFRSFGGGISGIIKNYVTLQVISIPPINYFI